MPFLPILAIEIISALLISSVTPNAAATIKRSLHQALPLVFAQEDSSPPDSSSPSDSSAAPSDATTSTSSDSQPAQQSSSPSDSSSQPASSDQSGSTNGEPSTVNQSSSPSDTNSTSTPDQTQSNTTNSDSTLLNDINSQAQQTPTEMSTETPQANQSSDRVTPSEQSSQSNNSGSESLQSFSVISDEPAVSQASTTVLNSEDIVGGPAETVDAKTVEMAQKQDEQISKASTPAEIATLSIDFAKDSVKEAENNIRSNDFSTSSFVAQRLSDQIDTALEQSQKSGGTKLQSGLNSFCRQADLLLRSQQLAVPEQGEQDFEIIRGKCFDILQ